MLINKFTPSVDYNYLLKCLDTEILEPNTHLEQYTVMCVSLAVIEALSNIQMNIGINTFNKFKMLIRKFMN